MVLHGSAPSSAVLKASFEDVVGILRVDDGICVPGVFGSRGGGGGGRRLLLDFGQNAAGQNIKFAHRRGGDIQEGSLGHRVYWVVFALVVVDFSMRVVLSVYLRA